MNQGNGIDEPIQKIFCEGEAASLECPAGKYIGIRLANYGRFTLALCNPSHRTDLSTTCQNDRTLEFCWLQRNVKLSFCHLILGKYSERVMRERKQTSDQI
ncbi:unnamed protein product [Thelazia callipaeda]|uniref:SUEL-type lectin domain-containing protein n=1 Tax=Thelazia callipaeda TaxID=103827 RepID=A0A0N5CYW1_THECL|nr:unnamed protein product [Thelazia callipaeda]